MRYAKRDKETEDLPSIWITEGRFVVNCGPKTWRRQWEEVYKYEVVHWKTKRGTRLNLDSLIEAVYPTLKDDAQGRALFANAFLWKSREERRRSGEVKKRKRLAEDKNEGGTQ